MSRKQVIEILCAIVGLAYHSIGDYSHASDCICNEHPDPLFGFAHQGVTLAYVRQAVTEKLERDRHSIDENSSKQLDVLFEAR